MLYDLPLEELLVYKPERSEPHGFDAFWKKSIEESQKYALNARFIKVDFNLALLNTIDVTFNGFGGQPVKGWFICPKKTKKPLPYFDLLKLYEF